METFRDNLHDHFNDATFSDMELTVIGVDQVNTTIHVHRLVLIMASEWFKTFFSFGNNRGAHKLVLDMDTMSVAATVDIIKEFYGITIDTADLLAYTQCRHFFGLPIDTKSIYGLRVPPKNFDSLVNLIANLDYDIELMNVILANMPEDYDLSNLTKEFVQQLLDAKFRNILVVSDKMYWYDYQLEKLLEKRSETCANVAISDNSEIIIFWRNSMYHVYDVKKKLWKTYEDKNGTIIMMKLSPDNTTLAIAYSGQNLQIRIRTVTLATNESYHYILPYGRNGYVCKFPMCFWADKLCCLVYDDLYVIDLAAQKFSSTKLIYCADNIIPYTDGVITFGYNDVICNHNITKNIFNTRYLYCKIGQNITLSPVNNIIAFWSRSNIDIFYRGTFCNYNTIITTKDINIKFVKFSPDDKFLMIGLDDNSLQIYKCGIWDKYRSVKFGGQLKDASFDASYDDPLMARLKSYLES